MTPERLMHIYLDECRLHSGVLAEALEDAHTWLPFNAKTVQHLISFNSSLKKRS